MQETVLSRCDVCGSLADDDGCCKTCGTILVEGKVQCRVCGDPLRAYSLICYSCGSKREKTPEIENTRERKEAVLSFLQVPGLGEETAEELYDGGVKDFASLVGMALTESQRTQGLHHVIARRIMLMDVIDTEHEKAEIDEMECPVCKSIVDASSEMCQICGHFTRIRLEKADKDLEAELNPVMDKIRDEISLEKAFREMPTDFQEELSNVLIEIDERDLQELEEEEEERFWEEIDSDLDELEKGEVADDAAKDEAQEAQRIVIICPLCEAEVVQDARYCYNCGAHFQEP